MYGMRMSFLTPMLMDEILDTYERVCEVPSNTPFARRKENLWTGAWHIESVEKWLHRGYVEWRYGSGLPGKAVNGERFDTNSKFFVRSVRNVHVDADHDDVIIRFSFDPNVVSGERAEKMKKNFEIAVDRLLIERGVGIPLEET